MGNLIGIWGIIVYVAKFSRDELKWSVVPESKTQKTDFGSDFRLQMIPLDVLEMWWCSMLGVAANWDWDCWKKGQEIVILLFGQIKTRRLLRLFLICKCLTLIHFLIAVALLTHNFLLL